jgi:dihydroneopterin aldolase
MLKVGIYDAEFYSRHGFYEEEQIIGNRFMVTIEVAFQNNKDLNADKITHTINYEQLYAIAEEEMQQPKKLLETVGQSIADRITRQFAFIKALTVSVKKLNPPLRGTVGHSGITILWP